MLFALTLFCFIGNYCLGTWIQKLGGINVRNVKYVSDKWIDVWYPGD